MRFGYPRLLIGLFLQQGQLSRFLPPKDIKGQWFPERDKQATRVREQIEVRCEYENLSTQIYIRILRRNKTQRKQI